MSSLTNVSAYAASGHPRKEYITTSAFNNDIYTYTTSLNSRYETVGTLSVLATATAGLCPANRILRETGRRLLPGANPGISTLLVGVYDQVSGLNGLIDPNSPRFAVYSGDKSVFQDFGYDPSTGAQDRGPPVYTTGSVTAGAGLVATAGGLTVSQGNIVVGTPTTVVGTATAATFNLATSNIFIHSTTVTGGVTYTIQNSTVGCVFYVIATCDGTPRAITWSGGTFNSSVASLPASSTIVVTVVRTA